MDRRWLVAVLGLAVLGLGTLLAVRGGARRAELAGTWRRETAPGTTYTMLLRRDGTGVGTQVTTKEGIPSPQRREFRWILEDDTINTFSTARVPWWCQDWMLKLHVMAGFGAPDHAEVVSVTDDKLTLRPKTSAEDVVFDRVVDEYTETAESDLL
jgi:hypothetical protein